MPQAHQILTGSKNIQLFGKVDIYKITISDYLDVMGHIFPGDETLISTKIGRFEPLLLFT